MWPYSYNKCDEDNRMSQEVSACSKVNHYGMAPFQGRGAPEIDVLETMQGTPDKLPSTNVRRPYLSASLQVAPGLDTDRPVLGERPSGDHWYSDLEYGNETAAELNPFFYGVTLVHEPDTLTYQADALSANMGLKQTHYADQHKYRVEWEPPEKNGTGGYVKWFVDDMLMYGISGDSLALTGAEIPSEPMYLLMNTAVSQNWGFPLPCPSGCKCSCFQCGKRECMCGMPEGYCDNFPSNFEIDYVRVYQAVDEPKHILGCSPPDRPTELFIQGHKERFMEEGDKRPLEPVSKGGAVCTNSTDCGGEEMGFCNFRMVCECFEGFTGPTCLAYDGFYDFEVSSVINKPIDFTLMMIPRGLMFGIIVFFFGLVCAYSFFVRELKQQKTLDNAVNNGSSGQNHASYGAVAPRTIVPKPESSFSNGKVVKTYTFIDKRLTDQ